MIVPNTVVILMPAADTVAGNGWIRTGSRNWPPRKKSRMPNRPAQPIPTFDRKALRDRVNRLLKQTQHQREELRVMAFN
jgi:hypothetical protein